ncbi:MAG: CAAX prenyl protease-related protein [Bryobacteraceae bacterium]
MLKHPAVPYVAPFVVFLAFMAGERALNLDPAVFYPVRAIVVSLLLIFVSRPVLDFRPAHVWGSLLIGVVVFVIWIGPDVLWPGYRSHWLFHNSIVGKAASAVPESLKSNYAFIFFRGLMGCTIAVPILEELFWRGWLTRWLIDGQDFRKAPMGAYTPSSFWIGSLLFASEHGSYWEVGLMAGMLYNWWMIRARRLADCIIAHMTTNGCLSIYVLATGKWQYWL